MSICPIEEAEKTIADLNRIIEEKQETVEHFRKENDKLRCEIAMKRDAIKALELAINIKDRLIEDLKEDQITPATTSYEDKATDLRKRYEALVKAGFDHDSAMSLIPLWWDEG